MIISIDFSNNILDLESLIEEANEENKPLDKYIIERINLSYEIDGLPCSECKTNMPIELDLQEEENDD